MKNAELLLGSGWKSVVTIGHRGSRKTTMPIRGLVFMEILLNMAQSK